MIDTTTAVPLRPLTVSGDDLRSAELEPVDDHLALDPHVWLDPTAVSRIAQIGREHGW